MKTILLITLVIASALRGEELVPELAPLAQTRETALTALDEQKATALTAAHPPYLTVLNAADQAAMAAGKVQIVKAIARERESVEKGGMAASLPTDLPKNLDPPRRAFLKACERIETDFGQKRKTLDAGYLRDLAGLQFKAASNPKLAAQIAVEKEKVVSGAYGPITDLAVGLPNTRWKQVGQDTVLHFKDGKINGVWAYETPSRDKLVIHWNGNSSATLTLGRDGKSFVEGGKVGWELLSPETHF